MIYGYDTCVVNEYGLRQMREISFDADADPLRELAAFLASAADTIDEGVSERWHVHIPEALQRKLACDVVVCSNRPVA